MIDRRPMGWLLAALLMPLSARPDSATLLGPLSVEGHPGEIYYHAQAARDGVIELTPVNGFYRGFVGEERVPDAAHDPFMPATFRYLVRKPDAAGDIRWHLHCEEAGELRLTFFAAVTEADAKVDWPVRVGDEVQALRLVAGEATNAQPQALSFDVKKPGPVTVKVDASRVAPEASLRLARIRVEGPALAKAHLLRARFRPAAIHAGFRAPAACAEPDMWVFETRNPVGPGGFAPLTTPFGYFGTSFKHGKIPVGAGFNFSLWASGSTTNIALLEQMPRVIAMGFPDAKFGGWSTAEGTGVKPQAIAYTQAVDRAIQALRVDFRGGVRTYYGYMYDESQHRWRLYCAAQKPDRPSRRPAAVSTNAERRAVLDVTGSFLEVPGAPGRQMSGDLRRTVERRGWFHGRDGRFYPMVVPEARRIDERPVNQWIAYAEDYEENGWVELSTGGLEQRKPSPRPARTPPQLVPEYLQPGKAGGLFEVPVDFGASRAVEVGTHSAVVEYELKATGAGSKATLYYDVKDALTFTPDYGIGAAVGAGSKAMTMLRRPERTWRHRTEGQPVAAGTHRFSLVELRPATRYHYRLYVEHQDGRSWDYQSGSFMTAASAGNE